MISVMKRCCVGLIAAAVMSPSMAQRDFSGVEFRQTELAEGLVLLQGAGGNIAALPGSDGLLIIDDDYSEMEDKLMAVLADLQAGGPKFVLNTHWHFDHAGGNTAVGRDGATIVAHKNVRERLKAGGTIAAFGAIIPPADRSALPAITYSDTMSMHWNELRLELKHSETAHTDGDTVVYLYRDDKLLAVHLGDLFFNGFYPFIDASSGGSAMGVVSGVADVLAHIDDSTMVIPGHGPMASKADLQAYHDFLKTAVSRVAALKSSGKSLEQVVAEKPLADFEQEWGDGFLKTDVWLSIVYSSI